jgi:lipid-binding SYLF domain-containing protein
MKRILQFALIMLMSGAALASDRGDNVERLRAAGTVIDEVMAAPDKGIPQEILTSARCIAVVPSMMKGGFVVGAAYGKGVTSCRSAKGWTAPAFFSVRGGSFGFQIGGQAVDLIMVFMDDRGMNGLLQSKFKLGADGSVAAGPVGRHAEGATDWKMRNQVLTYSRARGLFAGVSLNGAVITQHKDDTRAFYGRMVPFSTILRGEIETPADAQTWVGALKKYGGAGVSSGASK